MRSVICFTLVVLACTMVLLPGPAPAQRASRPKKTQKDSFPQSTQGSQALSPEQSLAAFHTHDDLVVELVAAEPLVKDPVAISFGPDGRLWVAEMADYPAGLKGDYQPGGRIVVLEDTDGDGKYDKSTLFLDKIPFPTGITFWRKGVLICAAPDILYAEDTDGDGKADVVKKLYSGFGTTNFQARVNSLEYGLDGWVYGSCGMFGGRIKRFSSPTPYALGHRDFRIHPDTGDMEPATGRTQQGRVRDDWGNWFGCDNTNLLWHYPLADHYLRRNPYVTTPQSLVDVPAGPNPQQLFPANKQMQLFSLSGPPGQTTAACGLGVYRDDLLGKEYTGNTFTCEAVDLLVHRLQLFPRESSFIGRRAANEKTSEFLASTDPWCRPVQMRTGPDGAIWVVDMYRYVIEHPRWIPPEDLAKLDLRAGENMGRIYRVRPRNGSLRPVPRFDRLDTAGLVAALDNPNGTQRDLASQMLLWKADKSAVPALEKLAAESARPEARLHAMCVLDVLAGVPTGLVKRALCDAHPGVRRHAVRIAEKSMSADPEIGPTVAKLITDPDAQVRLQAACSLGEWRDGRAGQALGAVALAHADDRYLTAAALSSMNASNLREMVKTILASKSASGGFERLVGEVVRSAASMSSPEDLPVLLEAVAGSSKEAAEPWRLSALAGALDSLDRRRIRWQELPTESTREAIQGRLAQARATVASDAAAESLRVAALPLLGREPDRRNADIEVLGKLLDPAQPGPLQDGSLAMLGTFSDDRPAALLVASWKSLTPRQRSQALELFLGRSAWQGILLDAIAKQQIPSSDVDSKNRQRLLDHRDPQYRALAAKLFAGANRPDRQKVIDEYKSALNITGDRGRGQAVFVKRCATCHRLNDTGFAVGPDLAALANKSGIFLLTEILDPNKNVDTRYIEFIANTRSGRAFNGILASESSSGVTLRGPDGKEQSLLRSDIENLQSTGKSLMPEGLEKDLSQQDVADVIAYLGSTRSPPKPLRGNVPTVLSPAKGVLTLTAEKSEIRGDEISYEHRYRNVGAWLGEHDSVTWEIQQDKDATYDVYLDWSCSSRSAGNKYIIEGAVEPLRGTVASTGGRDKYAHKKIGTITIKGGRQRIMVRSDGPIANEPFMDLRTLYLVPPGQQPEWTNEQKH